jgi:hypothetical protein
MDRTGYISASEIGDFTYCKRGWWLRRQGLLKTNFAMQQGTDAHDSILKQLLRLKLLQNILIWSGIIVLILMILLLIFV